VNLKWIALAGRWTRALLLGLATSLIASAVASADVIWVDWHTILGNGDVEGTATVAGGTVTVTYSGERAFVQTSCGTNYWNPAAPYLSATVPNAPPDCDIIALSQATAKTLTFSEPVANVFFAVVSLNGNGYRFDRDFDILSFGCGYWGCGTLTKEVNPPTYDLIGTGEPHGVIQLLGSFSSVSWTSLSNENWNGFSVGFEETVANLMPSVTIAGTTDAAEPATNGQFTVTSSLEAGPGGLSVTYSVGGSSTASPSDYGALSGSVVIAEGQTSVSLPVVVIDDAAIEGTETLVLNLTSGEAYELGSPSSASIDILDDDVAPPPAQSDAPIPALGSWGLFLMVALFGIIGFLMLTRYLRSGYSGSK
jgi:hypothetical protein